MLEENDFIDWCKVKISLNFLEEKDKFIREGQVWYISIGANIGNENYGKGFNFKRPILVIKKVGNLFFGVSLTTKGKQGSNFNYILDDRYFNRSDSFLNLSQVKTYDKKRFIQHICTIDENDFKEIKKELKRLLF